MKKFTSFYSATVLGLGNNNGINLSGGEYEFVSTYKLRVEGKNTFKLFFINEVESTGNCRPGKKGDGYEIKEAAVTFMKDGTVVDKTPVTFGGKPGKSVLPGEEYETDEFELSVEKDGCMYLSIKASIGGRAFLPGTNESASKGQIFLDGSEIWCDSFTLRPFFIGVRKNKEKTVGFWGDSITQGTRTRMDMYEAWTHRIGHSMSENISFVNLGMGWSRAYDGALGGVFFEKASMCDELFMCFGVNDIRSGGRMAEELIDDIKNIKEMLLKKNECIKIHFLTIPPFNMSKFEEAQRKKVNEYIRSTEGYFDIATVLEKDGIGSVKDEFMASKDDAHPNGLAGEAVFEAFNIWREENKW